MPARRAIREKPFYQQWMLPKLKDHLDLDRPSWLDETK